MPLPPIQLARNKRYKPNLVRAVGKKELKISENERKKKPEAEQKDEFDNTVMVSFNKSKALPSKLVQSACSLL